MPSSAMPVDIWFHIFSGVIYASLLLVLFPIYKILEQTWCRNPAPANNNNKPYSINISSPDEDASFLSKSTITLAALAFFGFIALCSFNTTLQYINIEFLDQNYCIISLITLWSLYIAGKFFVITYFIFRAYDSFKYSKYSFNSMVICMIYPFAIVVLIGIIVPLGYIVATNDIQFTLNIVQIHDKQYGFQCDATYSNNSENIQWAIYGAGAIIDILFTVGSVCLFLYKFAVIIQESAKQHAVISNSRANSYHSSFLSNGGSPEMDIDTRTRSIDPQEVIDFHAKTKEENRWLLLMTKLLVLLIIDAISTIIAFLIFYLSKVYYFGYILDAMICMYCLFLSFESSDYYYYEIFCGYKFSKFCFPFTKTSVMTLRCLNQDCCGPHAFCWCNDECCHICFKCECGGCCFCCRCYGACCKSCYGNHQKKQRQFYLMAKSEVDLLLATLNYKESHRKDDDLWN